MNQSKVHSFYIENGIFSISGGREVRLLAKVELLG
jgi:hypothetical protein